MWILLIAQKARILIAQKARTVTLVARAAPAIKDEAPISMKSSMI